MAFENDRYTHPEQNLEDLSEEIQVIDLEADDLMPVPPVNECVPIVDAQSLGSSLAESGTTLWTSCDTEIPMDSSSESDSSIDIRINSPIQGLKLRSIYAKLEAERAAMLERTDSPDERDVRHWHNITAERDRIFRILYCQNSRNELVKEIKTLERICFRFQRDARCPDPVMECFRRALRKVTRLTPLVVEHLREYTHESTLSSQPMSVSSLLPSEFAFPTVSSGSAATFTYPTSSSISTLTLPSESPPHTILYVDNVDKVSTRTIPPAPSFASRGATTSRPSVLTGAIPKMPGFSSAPKRVQSDLNKSNISEDFHSTTGLSSDSSVSRCPSTIPMEDIKNKFMILGDCPEEIKERFIIPEEIQERFTPEGSPEESRSSAPEESRSSTPEESRSRSSGLGSDACSPYSLMFQFSDDELGLRRPTFTRMGSPTPSQSSGSSEDSFKMPYYNGHKKEEMDEDQLQFHSNDDSG